MSDYPVFTIGKDEDAPMRAFRFAKDLYERIIEAENLAFMNEIKANTVVINGQKYGMLKDKPGFVPTIIGMKAETKADMPDDWDFFLQERPPLQKTNYDRIVSKSPGELAEWLAEVLFHCSNTICDRRCPMYECCCDQPSDNIEGWLKQEAQCTSE